MLGCVCAESLQSRLPLCDPVNCSPPGSSVQGILQARTLERGAVPLPGDLPNPGTEPESLMPPALAGVFFISSATWEAPEMRPCLVWYILIRLKSKMFLEVLFLNNPKIQESANKEMFCFSRSGETMPLFSSILFYHIRSLNEGQVASLLQKYLMGKLNPPS